MNFSDIKNKIFKKKSPADYILYSSIIALGILLDQITKYLTSSFMELYQSIPIIKDVIHITYVQNTGAAFGMMKDSRWVFMISSTVMIIALLLYLYLGHAENRLYGASMAMIISGGIGNMIDRIALGYVVDFIDFTLIDFAVFNGADSFVCVGAGLLILALILDIVKEQKAEKEKNNGTNR